MAEEIFEFILEVIVDNIVDIGVSVVPENKYSEKLETRIMIVVAVLTVIFLGLFVVGICMIGESNGESILGKIFICLTPLQFVLSFVIYIVRRIKEKLKNKRGR